MIAAMRMSNSILITAVLLLAPTSVAVTLPSVGVTASSAAPSSVKRQRNYGPLGNLIASAIDKWFARSSPVPQPSAASAAAAFEEARVQSLSTSAATMGPEQSQARQKLYNYGLLGNIIAGFMDGASGHRNASIADAKSSTSAENYATVSPDPDLAGRGRIPLKQRSYGLLGNMISGLFGGARGVVQSPDEVSQSARAGSPVSSTSEDGAAREKKNVPRNGLKALKGVRQFVQMLGSSFVPDPAFERAAFALKQRDHGLGIDAAAGEGGFISAGELDSLLSRVKVNSASA